MMQGPIRRSVQHRIERRDEARLPTAWIRGALGPSTWSDGAWLMRASPRLVGDADAPVLVLLGNEGGGARAELLTHVSAGARVYVLVGPGWGRDETDSHLLEAKNILVRRIPEVPASAVLVGREARLWIGGGFVLRLDTAQSEALRQNFLRLFWHDATEEAWYGGQRFAWREACERPFDVPEITQAASVRWEPPEAKLANDVRGALLLLNAGPPPDTKPLRLWYPAGPDHHDRLAWLRQEGVDVMWTDRGLPDLLVTRDGGEVLLRGTRGRLRLRLTSNQASEVRRLLDEPPSWRFHADIRLGEAENQSARFWLPGEEAARKLEAEQRIQLPDVQALSLREVWETVPTSSPAPQPLALTAHFQWVVVPPIVPTGAQEDALVGRWRKIDEDWNHRLGQVRDALQAAEEKRGRIGRAFSRLMSAMLGFERTQCGLLAKVGALDAKLPSAEGPSGAPVILSQLVEIEDASRRLQSDLEDAERQARESDEREEQMTVWKGKVEAAERSLPNRRVALTTAESLRMGIADELRGVDESLKSAGKEVKRDLAAKKRKLSDELQRAMREVTRVRSEIEALEQQVAEPFEFRPQLAPIPRQATGGGRFVPSASSARVTPFVPDEALPEVGSLHNYKSQRYLVIQTWEELTAGEQAASRLSAKLVAPESA